MIAALAAAVLQDASTQSAARGAVKLWGDYSLADPPFLILLPVALLLFAWGRSRRARAHGRVPFIPSLPARSLRQRLLWVPRALQVAALLFVIVSLSRPLLGNVTSDVVSEGVDIVLAVDRSSSMRFDDLEAGKNRLEVVKEVVGDFAERRMTDRVGAADHCALLAFAHYPQLLCPFTLDVGALEGFLENVQLVDNRDEDGTAIGIALAKAVAILRESDAKSKVCVLLTDGENNVHDITPSDAAELAAEEKIRVYTIYAARYVYRYHSFRGWVPTRDGLDTTELQRIAEVTGGRFYQARDRASLEQIYAEIEKLERTERRERHFEETYDLYPWFLLPAVAAYVVGWLSRLTWARRLP